MWFLLGNMNKRFRKQRKKTQKPNHKTNTYNKYTLTTSCLRDTEKYKKIKI